MTLTFDLQLVRITVKSVFKEGESPENAPPIVLNPRELLATPILCV